MGWFSRLVNRFDRSSRDSRGARLEAAGRLEEAFSAYREAGQLEDAARILLARAEAEPDLVQRKTLLNVVLSNAPASSPIAAEATKRRALVSLEILRSLPGPIIASECHSVAADLEAASLYKQAAEAYQLAGDTDGQTRMLAACGAIDALESTFDQERKDAAQRREREQLWKTVRDLDAIGRRREALASCRAWLEHHPGDEDIIGFAREVEQRLVRPGALRAELDGRCVTIVVDPEVVVGRADAGINIPSPALSRRHLILHADAAGPLVSDAGSRNGTTLAGTRIDGALPVGDGLDLVLGGQVPIRMDRWGERGVSVSVSGQLYVASFGPLRAGPFSIDRSGDVMQLRASGTAPPPVLNGLTCDAVIDLCRGDEVRASREGPVIFKVVPS